MLKSGQKEVTTKDFYGQRQITDIFTIDINKVVVSAKVPCNNGKDCRYIVGYQVDGALTPLFINAPRDIFSYGVSQYEKNSTYEMSFNGSSGWTSQYKKIWIEVESQLFEKLATESIKGEGILTYRLWEVENVERTKNKFSWSRCSNATAVLKIDSVYKQGKNYHPHTYVEECKYTDAENKQCNILSDDDGFFEV